MAYEGWIEYNGTELVNIARTVQLARAIGVHTVRSNEESIKWIQDEVVGASFGMSSFGVTGFGGFGFGDGDYTDITEAPWYDPGYPASSEFAGIVPLAFAGLDDSTATSSPTEYVGDGGHSGSTRNATLSIVASVAIVAKSDRGAEYGKRWMDRILKASGPNTFCSGANLRYFRYKGDGAPMVHRRDVKLSRGSSVTRKKTGSCSSTWLVTFTMTAGDPYEYGEEEPRFTGLGGTPDAPAGAPELISTGVVVLTQLSCPAYNYTPIYDPLYPALIPAPTAPDFYPDGWGIVDGETFDRFWVRVQPVEPTSLLVVPIITLTASEEARMIRVSVWPGASDTSDQCDPLFSAVVTYLPPNQQFVLDGEQKAAYVWDGFSPSVRRSDSVVYAPDARPIQWTSFTDLDDLLVTLDIFSDSESIEGNGSVRASLSLVPKSD